MKPFNLATLGLLALLAASVASAAPDCNWSGRWSNRPTDQADGITTFTTNGSTAVPGPAVNNTATGCSAWIVIVDVEGFSADSVVFQSAPTASPGVAGTFTTFAGTTTSGSNPTTTTTSSTYLATGYYPWFRINVTTVTGTPGSINVQVFGWRSQAYLSAGAAQKGTPIYPCVSSSGSGTTYTCTTGSSVTLAQGMLFSWQPDTSCSGSPTLNIDGNGAVSLSNANLGSVSLTLCQTAAGSGLSSLLLMYNANVASRLIVVNQPQYTIAGNCTTTGIVPFIYNLGGLTGIVCPASTSITGCSATIGTNSTVSAGFYTSGTTGTCGTTITFGITAPTGWICYYNDITTTADTIKQTSYGTSTALSSGTTVSGDVIYYNCNSF